MDKGQIDKLKQAVGLQPYQSRLLLQRTGNEWKAICPWHPDRTPSLSVYKKGEIFLFKCWGSDASQGDVIAFVMKHDGVLFAEAVRKIAAEVGFKMEEPLSERKELHFDKPSATATLLASEEALAYLGLRGISPEVAAKRDLGLLRYPGVGLCIAIPYPTGDVKFRALAPKDKQHKFRSLGNPNSKLYGIELLEEARVLGATNVLVVESELDQITASEHLDRNEFVVISVPSATGSLSGGELRIEKEHIEKLKEYDGKVFLATDQDRAGEQWAAVALKDLPAYKTSRVTWSGAKDIGELFTRFGEKFADEISRLCQDSLVPLLWRKAIPFSLLPERKFQWIVPDLIPADGVTLLTGDFGSFKSYMSLFLADAIAGGGTFIQRECEPHPVLILDRENSHSTVYLRRNRVGNLAMRENVRILGLFTDPPAPDIPDSDLLAVCAKVKPVIIIDSLTDFHPGLKESDADDMTKCFAQIRALVTAGAASVIVLHHVPKNGKGKGGSYRGSTSIPAAGAAALFIEKEGKYTARIHGFKSRDGEEQKIGIKLSFGPSVTYEVIDAGRDPETELRDAIEDHVQQNPGCSAVDIERVFRKRHKTVRDTVNSMIRNGRLHRVGPKGGGKGSALYANALPLPNQEMEQMETVN